MTPLAEVSQPTPIAPALRRRPALGRGPTHRGQGLVEFMLITPLLLILIFGIMEAARLMAIYSGASSAAKQAARYGGVAGTNISGTVYYLDCAGIRNLAIQTSILHTLSPSDITITYDEGDVALPIGACGNDNIARFTDNTVMNAANSKALINSGRVVVQIIATYSPIVPLVPISDMPIEFTAARTIFTEIAGPTSTPRPAPDLVLTKSGPANAGPNTTVLYTLTVDNAGASLAVNVVLTDAIPAGVSNVSVTPNGWACTSPSAGTTMTCRLSYLDDGQFSTAPYVIVSMRMPNGNATVLNRAGVESNETDAVPADNFAQVSTSVISGPDLALTMTDNPYDPAAPGGTVTYTINITNTGVGTANTPTFTQTFPANVGYVSYANVSGVTWNCTWSNATHIVTCTAPNMVAGAVTVLRIRSSGPSGDETIATTAGVVGANGDGNLNNNSATEETTYIAYADLAVQVLNTPNIVGLGGTITFTIEISNLGTSTATNVQLINALPGTVGIVSITSTGWSCSGTLSLSCSMAALTVGPAPSIVIVVTAPNAAATSVSDSANVASADMPDPNNGNNAALATTSVLDCHPGVIAASNSPVTRAIPQIQSDNTETDAIYVTVRDDCGTLLANKTVTLASSRGAVDTISPASATTDAFGQATFTVKSATVSPYTVNTGLFTPSTFTATVNGTIPLTPVTVAFACGVGSFSAAGLQDLQFFMINPSGIDRRLRTLTLTWPTGGGRKFKTVNLDAALIWSGNQGGSPITLDATTTNKQWDAAQNRSVTNGSFKTMKLGFDFNVAGTGAYTILATWDNGADNGSVCTSTSVTHTP